MFFAKEGTKRFACYVPYKEIADKRRVTLNDSLLKYLNSDIDEVYRRAEQQYLAKGLDTDGALVVRLL